ncbi:MAG: HU family DNA-binding protein [Clostridia bacterium]
MNKTEFVKSFAANAGLSVKDAAKTYDAFVSTVVDGLKADGKIQLLGFANFEIKDKPAREGINPMTKEKIQIKASKQPAAKFSKAFKETFNA